MEISYHIQDSMLSITLAGRFTFMENARFREIIQLLEKQPVRQIEIQAQDLSFVDSAALGMLLLIREEALKRTISIVLKGAQGQPEKMFAMARFDSLFTLVP